MGKVYAIIGLLVLVCFGLVFNASKNIETALFCVILLVIALNVLLLVTIVLIKWKKRGKKESKKKKPDTHHPAPAAHHDPHHASDGGHGHAGHPGHHEKSFVEKLYAGSVGILVILFLLAGLWWLCGGALREWQNNTTYSVGRAQTALAIAARSSGVTATQPVCPPLADDIPTVVTAPSKDGDWYFVDVPVCHRALFCDKARDPECKPMEAADERFDMACKDQKDRAQQHSTICRVRSKSAEPVELTVSYPYTGML